jgi:TP901-1 family phage major tail protein
LAAKNGRLLLIEVESAPGNGVFVPVGGLRTKSLKINNELVDITTDDSSGVRELLDGGGVNSMEASGSGITKDTLGFDILREAAENNEQINCRVTIPGDTYSRVYTGPWLPSEVEQTGEYKDSVQFKATLASAGAITKTRIGA